MAGGAESAQNPLDDQGRCGIKRGLFGDPVTRLFQQLSHLTDTFDGVLAQR
jgi:hypothetical protein